MLKQKNKAKQKREKVSSKCNNPGTSNLFRGFSAMINIAN